MPWQMDVEGSQPHMPPMGRLSPPRPSQQMPPMPRQLGDENDRGFPFPPMPPMPWQMDVEGLSQHMPPAPWDENDDSEFPFHMPQSHPFAQMMQHSQSPMGSMGTPFLARNSKHMQMPWQNQGQDSQFPFSTQDGGSSSQQMPPMPWQMDSDSPFPMGRMPPQQGPAGMMRRGGNSGPPPFPSAPGSSQPGQSSQQPMMPQGGQAPMLMLLHPHMIPQGSLPDFIQSLMQAAEPQADPFGFADADASSEDGSQEMSPEMLPFAGL